MALTVITKGPNHNQLKAASVAANGLNTSDVFPTAPYTTGSFQVVWASHDDSSTFELQMSDNGGDNWDTIPGTSKSTNGASGSMSIVFNDSLPAAQIRLKVTEADGNSGATLVTSFTGKEG